MIADEGRLGESVLQKVRNDLQSTLPSELVDVLMSSYEQIKQNFYLGKHEPSELNGGKFVEACVRILQYATDGGKYIPIAKQIPNVIAKLRGFEQIPASAAIDSYRIHMPRTLATVYNVRNKRGVGHLGGDVNPNKADASLVVACADWVMAELLRIHYQCSLEEAQARVDTLVQRRLVLVHDVGGMRRVLHPWLSLKDQTLLLLGSEYPNRVAESDLLAWTEAGNKWYFRKKVLGSLHSERLIEYQELEWCEILPPGLRYVESKYAEWLDKLEEGD